MTNASWSTISGFGGSIESVPTPFGDNVGGGAYFEVGTHKDVTIETVELKVGKDSGNPYLKITYLSDSGARISSNVMFNKKDGTPGFHFTYGNLSKAVVTTPELQMRTFGKLFPSQPQLLDSLRGLKVSITIAKGKEGYVIEKNGLGHNVAIDIATGKEYPEFAGKVFESFQEIKDACKEYSIKRMYNEVKSVNKGSDEAVAANEEALSEVLRSAEATPAAKAGTQSRANRPGRTL